MLHVQSDVDQHEGYIDYHNCTNCSHGEEFEVSLSEEEKAQLNISSDDNVVCDCVYFPLDMEKNHNEEKQVHQGDALTIDAYQLGLLLGGFLSSMHYMSYSRPCCYYDCYDRSYYDCCYKNCYDCCDNNMYYNNCCDCAM
ncbi:hypothetical protein DRF75_03060 [Ehrlichia minasensis]|uniref:Uncharacterized protein n=1 Tax=Ehrlichia minasensis TaxID=1242993 RepID=A0A4Q6I9E1_9RICK|nr:hypothetical protein [Ehrlichia minasensis]RZB12637.1 hypothetical protein DRF75_03060 [Ehrlichia minasensis]